MKVTIEFGFIESKERRRVSKLIEAFINLNFARLPWTIKVEGV